MGVRALLAALVAGAAQASLAVAGTQHVLSTEADVAPTSPADWTRLSWDGLHINAPPNGSPPRFLTLSIWPGAELDHSSAELRFSQPSRRGWEDVALRCGSSGTLEACREDDLRAMDAERYDTHAVCKAVHASRDGRVLFDPSAHGCQTLADLWAQVREGPETTQEEILLSSAVRLSVRYERSASRKGRYQRDFWLGHLSRHRAAWPLSNAGWQSRTGNKTNSGGSSRGWGHGAEPNPIVALMADPYLPKAEKPKRNDALNGVDVSYARWNLGVSLRLPPLHGTSDASNAGQAVSHGTAAANAEAERQSTLEPVHSPVGGQVVYVSTYRRDNAPSSGRNDERGWVISIRDEWGFVWHLIGISPYHQHVYVGQYTPRGKVVGHVSLRPFLDKEPRDRDSPVDPPEKPPGGDGNPRYPYWRRELRIGLARPSTEWHQWRGPYEDGTTGEDSWTWYNPLHQLSSGRTDGHHGIEAAALPPPPLFEPTPYIFFARPAPYPPTPPQVFASSAITTVADQDASLLDVDDGDGDDGGDELPELSGNVEVIVGLRSFTPSPHGPDSGITALEPVGIYKLEWAVVPDPSSSDGASNQTSRYHATTCAGLAVSETSWRVAFEHAKIRRRSSHAAGDDHDHDHDNRASAFGWDDETTEGDGDSFWKYIVPAFTTGRFAWTRKRYASQFDWKDRSLFYPLTRTVLTSDATAGQTEEGRDDDEPKASRVLPKYGSWDTRLDSPPGSGRRPDGNGADGRLFYLAVRATDSWGGVTCARTKTRVRVRN
ncbi:unnamed protein product [Parajaminaea phylloscopi]